MRDGPRARRPRDLEPQCPPDPRGTGGRAGPAARAVTGADAIRAGEADAEAVRAAMRTVLATEPAAGTDYVSVATRTRSPSWTP